MSEPAIPYNLGPEPFRGWYRPVLDLIPRSRPAILGAAEGDLIEITRDGESSLHRVTSAVPSKDGFSVTIRTEPVPGDAASPYRAEIVQDEAARCSFW